MDNKIRNFCIIAHIDHGKSTLADRMLEKTHAVSQRDMKNQLLDNIEELEDVDASLTILASARTGEGVTEIMESIVKNIPAPAVSGEEAKALIFDSHYDPYTRVILNVRVISGNLRPGMRVYMLATGQSIDIEHVGYYIPQEQNIEVLKAGEVGFIATGLKDAFSVRVGDTISRNMTAEPIQGYKEIQPLVFSGFFPADSKEQEKLRDAVEKLALNDSAFVYQPEVSAALGFGFLGVLHMEIVQERLEREFGVEIISTAPSVEYHVQKKNGEMVIVNNLSEFPDFGEIDYVEEPMVDALIIVPTDAIGNIMKLCDSKRGIYKNMDYINGKTARLYYELPMSEIVYDFYDSLKSLSHGYSTVEYLPGQYKKSDLLKMDIYLNDEIIDAFSFIVTRDSAYEKGKEIVEKMKYLIPRKLYPMPVQAVVENKAIARADVPQEAFHAILSL